MTIRYLGNKDKMSLCQKKEGVKSQTATLANLGSESCS